MSDVYMYLYVYVFFPERVLYVELYSFLIEICKNTICGICISRYIQCIQYLSFVTKIGV